MCNNCKGPQKLLSKLLGGISCSKELCFNKSKVSNLEVGCWKLFGVCQGLIHLLSIKDGSAKFLVKFAQVYNKVLSSGRSKVMFRVDSEVQVIAFIGKERQDSSSTEGIVVGEFCKGKE